MLHQLAVWAATTPAPQQNDGPTGITASAVMILGIALAVLLVVIAVIVVVDRSRVHALKQAKLDRPPEPRRR